MTTISIGNMLDAALSPFTLGKQQAPAVAKSEKESTGDPMEDYVVELSEAAKELAKADNPFDKVLEKAGMTDNSGDGEESADDNIIADLKKRIQQLQQEIQEIQDKDVPDEQKQQELSMKQSELAQLQLQLMKAYEDGLSAEPQLQSITGAGGLT